MASNYNKYIVQHGERALFDDFSRFRDRLSCCSSAAVLTEQTRPALITQAQVGKRSPDVRKRAASSRQSILQVTGSAAGCRRTHDQVSVITCSLRRAALDLPQIPELVGVTSRYKLGYRNVPRHSRGAHAHAVKTPRCLQPPHQHILSLFSPLRSISALCKV
jgi:hypothetical protein